MGILLKTVKFMLDKLELYYMLDIIVDNNIHMGTVCKICSTRYRYTIYDIDIQDIDIRYPMWLLIQFVWAFTVGILSSFTSRRSRLPLLSSSHSSHTALALAMF